MKRRAILVGEDNPHSAKPEHALYPYPRNCAGERLCRLVFQCGLGEYLNWFERVNLCASTGWSARVARLSAMALVQRVVDEFDNAVPLVLLGAKVAKAFGLEHEPFTTTDIYLSAKHEGAEIATRVVQLPHPSGRCRAWNVTGSFDKARDVLRRAGVDFASSLQ